MPKTLPFLPLLAASTVLSATSSKHDQFTQAQSPAQSDVSETVPQTTIRVNSNLVVLSVSVKGETAP